MSFKNPPLDTWKNRLFVAGEYQVPLLTGFADATSLMTVNQLYAVPFVMGRGTGILDRIGLEVTTASTGTIRLGIYQDRIGRPGQLLLDAGTISGAVAAYQEITIACGVGTSVDAWLVAVAQGGTPTVRSRQLAPTLSQMNYTGPGGAISSYAMSPVPGALPSSFVVDSVTGEGIKILVRGQ